MAKKRKAGAGRSESSSGPNMDVGESRKRIRDFEDVADSDDEFHINREKVLLDEEPQAKRRRKVQEEEEFLEPSDDEVLGDEDEEEEDEAERGGRSRLSGAGSDDEEDFEGQGDDYDEDEELPWGTSKEDLYGADAIETEEQALEEEAEALRLQKRQLQSMSAADYGFDESEWQEGGDKGDGDDEGDVVTEKLPQLQISPEMGQAERLKLLKSRYPEFEPLSKELLEMREVHAQLVDEIASEGDGALRPNAQAKLRAASAYLGSLAMYFALLTSPASSGNAESVAMPAAQLRDHPLMDTLVACRDLWQRATALPEDILMIDDELSDVTNEPIDEHIQTVAPKKKQPSKSRAERHAEAAAAAAKARKAEKIRKVEADLADLGDLTAPSRTKKATKTRRIQDEDSDVGEEAPLTAQEAAEKAKRKKSLRFYTSQIAQKANKRGAAGRNAGGDDDIPYRERLRDRQARLNAEAEKRGQRDIDPSADLGGESDEDDARQAQDVRAGAEDDDYYDLVAARTTKKKSEKAALAAAQKQAALEGGQVVQEESVGDDGKRKISYAIEKNKGLTPHRKKDVRNPRVKKRKKFDEKRKKLGSVRAVYKGGEGKGGYGGELTGIKKGLVKSTKL